MPPAPALSGAQEYVNGAGGTMSGLMGGLKAARSKIEGTSKDIDDSLTSEVHHARKGLVDDVSVLKETLQQKLMDIEAIEKGIEKDIEAGEKDMKKEASHIERDITAARVEAGDYVRETFYDEKR